MDAAVAHAALAFPAWAAVAPGDRARLLRRFADAVAAYEDELAALSATTWASRWRARGREAAAVADVLHYYAGAVDKLHGATIPVAGGVDLTFHEPLGVVGLITPWNSRC